MPSMRGKRESMNINIEIKDLPAETNRILNVLAKIAGSQKGVVIRAALIEYADVHKADITKFVSDMQAAAMAVEE